MSWAFYALLGILFGGVSDLFRKLGSNLKDPIFANLLFQGAAFFMAIILFFIMSRKVQYDPRSITYALIGGALLSVFTAFSFKALMIGPGVSTVMPAMRIGIVVVVVVLGLVLLRESLTPYSAIGILLAAAGIGLIFSGK